jgi:hypothetical protein
MGFVRKGKLPRLPREFYRGRAMVFWTHTLEDRAEGWLNERFHHVFREVLLHACARHGLVCPCYVLMPDHWHLVWMGLVGESDQLLSTAFLRKHLANQIAPARLQDRAHDHVLREDERERGSFQEACSYVIHNPERAKLVASWRDWPFLGAMAAGYPDLDPRLDGFWPDFWRIYNRLVDPRTSHRVEGDAGSDIANGDVPALPRRATVNDENL